MKLNESVEKSDDSGIIKSIDVDDYELVTYGKGILDEVNNCIIKTLKSCEVSGSFIISEISAKSIPATNTGVPVLQIEPLANGLLQLNLNTDALAGKTLSEVDEMFETAENTIVNSLEEAIIHESGHTKSIKGKTAEEIKTFYDELLNIHIGGISDIAYQDGAECLSEIEVLLYRGDNISKQAKDFYDKIYGMMRK